MRIVLDMIPKLRHGTHEQRVLAVAAIGMRFALAAYIVSSFLPYIDRLVPLDLSGSHVTILSAAIAAGVSLFIKTV